MTTLSFTDSLNTPNGHKVIKLTALVLRKPVNHNLISYIHKRICLRSTYLASIFRKLLKCYGYENVERLSRELSLLPNTNLLLEGDFLNDYFNLPKV